MVQSSFLQRVRFLLEWGLGGTRGMSSRKLLKLALLKLLEMHQFLKRWTFRPSMKALRKAVFKDETRKQWSYLPEEGQYVRNTCVGVRV